MFSSVATDFGSWTIFIKEEICTLYKYQFVSFEVQCNIFTFLLKLLKNPISRLFDRN